MASTVRLICPNLKCRTVLAVPETARGQVVRCRSCGMRIGVPANKSTKAAASSATPDADASTGTPNAGGAG